MPYGSKGSKQIDPKTLEPVDMGPIDGGGNVQPKAVPSPPPSSDQMSPEAQALERDYERRMAEKVKAKPPVKR